MSTFTSFLLVSVAFGGLSAVVAKMLPPYQPTPAAASAGHAHKPAPAVAAAPAAPLADDRYDSPLDDEPYEAAPPKKVDDFSDEEDDDDGPTQLIKPEQFGDLLDD